MPLSGGFAEVDITPPIGTWMGGYAFRPSGCVGVHDPLFARAAVFENVGKTVAILSMDLIGLDGDIVEAVRAGIERETGTAPAAVMLNCSHTHGGPLTKSFRTMGVMDRRYVGWLVRTLVDLTKQALKGMAHVSLEYGRSPVQIGVNRRQYGEKPEDTRIGVNASGRVMPWVDAIVVKDWRARHGMKAEVKAVLFSHACHPTTLGGDNLEITSDYCGYACDLIRGETHGEVMPIFLQGCCGNINPNPRGDFGWAKKHGEALGRATLKAVKHATLLDAERLDYAVETVDLLLEPPSPVEECEREVIRWESEAEKWRAEGNNGQTLHAEGLRDHALFECEAASLGDDHDFDSTMDIQRLTLGSAQILGFPAEMFVQYALDFDRQSSAPVLTLGCTNGVHGYVPIAADYPFGGYEVHGAHRYYAVLPYDPSCEHALRQTAYDLLGIRSPDSTPYAV